MAGLIEAVHESSESNNEWSKLGDKKIDRKISNAKKRLNSDAVQNMSFELLQERDSKGDVLSWFKKIEELLNSN